MVCSKCTLQNAYENLAYRAFWHRDRHSLCVLSLADAFGVLTNTPRWITVGRCFRSKPEYIPQGECRMARVGAGTAPASSPSDALLPTVLATIALCFVGNAFAHGGELNSESSHNDRKRGGGSSLCSDPVPSNGLAPSWIAPARVSQSSDAYANCMGAVAAGEARRAWLWAASVSRWGWGGV
jgi:hypothetical protein